MIPTSAATALHEVVVIHEQTREQWCAGRAAIEDGRIVVAGSRIAPAPDMFDGATATFTIAAKDGAGRARRYVNVTFDRIASRPPRRYVFV